MPAGTSSRIPVGHQVQLNSRALTLALSSNTMTSHLFLNVVQPVSHLPISILAQAPIHFAVDGKTNMITQWFGHNCHPLPLVGSRIISTYVLQHLSCSVHSAIMQSAAQIDVAIRSRSGCQCTFLSGYISTSLPMRTIHQLCPPIQAVLTITCSHEMTSGAGTSCTTERTGREAIVGRLNINRIPTVSGYRIAEHVTAVIPAEAVADIQLIVISKSSSSIRIGIRIVGEPQPCIGGRRVFPPIAQIGAIYAITSIETQSDEYLPTMYASGSINSWSEGRSTKILPTVGSRRVAPEVVVACAFAISSGEHVRLLTHHKTRSTGSLLRHACAFMYAE